MTVQGLAPEIQALLAHVKQVGGYASDEDVLRDALIALVDQRETIEGIRRGVADIEAGRFTEAQEFDRAFRAKHGIPGNLDE